MLTLAELQRLTKATGSRSLANVEIDILLTHLLECAVAKGLTKHLAFKGGTALRKMVFGEQGRISTDLDFTCIDATPKDDLSLMVAETFSGTYRNIEMSHEARDWYETEDGIGFTPLCRHPANPRGVKVKIQVSLREWPILPPETIPQSPLPFFGLLGFTPSPIPCLRLEEMVAEKIRAAMERSKGRDLYDLAEIVRHPACQSLDRPLVRSTALIKLCISGRARLSYETLCARLKAVPKEELADLQSLLRRDIRLDAERLVRLAADGYRFLNDFTEAEVPLVRDDPTGAVSNGTAQALVDNLAKRTALYPDFRLVRHVT